MASAFTMFEKFGDVCAALNEADRKELMFAICEYGMFGHEVELPYLLNAIFISLKEDIDNSKESRQRGSRGGRPRKGEQDKPEASDDEKPGVSETEKQGVSETEKPPVSETEKPHVSRDSQKTETQTNPSQTNPSQTKGGRRFAPPTRDDVSAYALSYAEEKRLDPGGFDAERFCDYYASNGWKVGRNPMKDWRATVRDWVRRDCQARKGAGDEYSDL